MKETLIPTEDTFYFLTVPIILKSKFYAIESQTIRLFE
jgi:hypothetical protein